MMEIVSADGRYDDILWKVFDMGNSTGVELPPNAENARNKRIRGGGRISRRRRSSIAP